MTNLQLTVFKTQFSVRPASVTLAVAAVTVGLAMMSAYVQTLKESVQNGVVLRQTQNSQAVAATAARHAAGRVAAASAKLVALGR